MTLHRTSSSLAVGCIMVALCSGCDESFEPIAPSEIQFSVYGYLDAAADTQWIRVMPLRPLLLTSPDPFDATVTIEHLATGRVVALRDSLFRFSHHQHPEVGSQGAYVHNFWTTEPIEPGATYRFSARRGDDEPAEAMVEIPAEYQVEMWISQVTDDSDYVEVTGLEHVALLTSIAHYTNGCGSGVDSTHFDGRSADDGVHLIAIARTGIAPSPVCGQAVIDRHELVVVGSASPWPAEDLFSPWRLGEPEQVSNVTNAVGFLGGVLVRTLPYERCTFQGGGPVPSHCELRYDGQSAALTGTVTETRCGDGPIDSVTVTLTEIDREPPPVRKIRTVLTGPSGGFEIRALEPGMRYFLRARAKPVPDPFWGEIDNYTIHTDTVAFEPGEEAEYDVSLRRLTDCAVAP